VAAKIGELEPSWVLLERILHGDKDLSPEEVKAIAMLLQESTKINKKILIRILKITRN
jgi:hypothetical protein